MSRAQFEELVDNLSTLLMTVDFGTIDSLNLAHQQIETVIRFLEGNRRHDLTRSSQELLGAIGEATTRQRLTPATRATLTRQLEQLTQHWYDAAKTWQDHASPNPQLLHLSEVADPALLAEFIGNTRLTAVDLDATVDQIRAGSLDAIATLRRSIHTLKGESGMLGLDDLGRLLHATESYLETPAPCSERADQLLRVRDWVLCALTSYENGLLPGEPVQPLVAALTATSTHGDEVASASIPNTLSPRECVEAQHATLNPPSRPEPQPILDNAAPGASPHPNAPSGATNDAPPSLRVTSAPPESMRNSWDEEELELVIEFLHEGKETAGAIDQTLLEIEREGPDPEHVNKLFRAFHTLKGVASFLRLHQIVALTHTTETMLDLVRGGKVAAEAGLLDLVFDATTLLRSLLEAVAQSVGQRTPLAQVDGTRELIQRIEATIRGEVPPGSALPAQTGSRIGEILTDNGAVSKAQLNQALAKQQNTGRKLGEELVSEGAVPAKVVAQALRGQTTAAQQTAKAKDLVKVDLERVDSLVETIGELVIVESMVSNAPEIQSLPMHLRNYLGQFAKITRELQELGMCMRMVPLRTEFQKMARMVRDLTRRSNKQVRIELRGEQTEMDRSMVEQIADPLVHLIRNAVDHGVEPPTDRIAAGKPETATVILSASHEGGSIVIEIHDDGRGIDRERVVAKAVSQGLVAEDATLSDSQVYDLLFMPGFSTAAKVTEISGRGVGMDVVKRNIEAMRGRILTQSVKGRGTSFRLILPLTLAIIDGMVIRSGGDRFIVPTLNIVESLQPSQDMLFSVAGASEHVLVRGQSLPLIRLGNLLEVDNPEQDPTKALAVIVESLHSKVALLVDEVVMKHQVVIKTLGSELGVVDIFAGAAILSNGRVGLILNVDSLVATALSNRRESLTAVA
jgi:two-component system, chemotaxis family, sensor kinase CheA